MLATSEIYAKKSTSRDTSRRRTLRLKRRGFALVEVLMTISLGSVVLGTSIIAVVLLMQMYSAERAHWETTAARGRLERQFREDARAASQLRACGGSRDRIIGREAREEIFECDARADGGVDAAKRAVRSATPGQRARVAADLIAPDIARRLNAVSENRKGRRSCVRVRNELIACRTARLAVAFS